MNGIAGCSIPVLMGAPWVTTCMIFSGPITRVMSPTSTARITPMPPLTM